MSGVGLRLRRGRVGRCEAGCGRQEKDCDALVAVDGDPNRHGATRNAERYGARCDGAAAIRATWRATWRLMLRRTTTGMMCRSWRTRIVHVRMSRGRGRHARVHRRARPRCARQRRVRHQRHGQEADYTTTHVVNLPAVHDRRSKGTMSRSYDAICETPPHGARVLRRVPGSGSWRWSVMLPNHPTVLLDLIRPQDPKDLQKGRVERRAPPPRCARGQSM